MSSTWSKWLIIGLLISNVALIAFLAFGRSNRRPHRGRGNPPVEAVAKILNFSEQQQAQFETLMLSHRNNIKTLDREIAALRVEALHQVEIDNSADYPDSIFQLIAKLQVQIEAAHYEHLKQVRDICTPEQKDHFSDFRNHIEQKVLGKRKMPPPHKR